MPPSAVSVIPGRTHSRAPDNRSARCFPQARIASISDGPLTARISRITPDKSTAFASGNSREKRRNVSTGITSSSNPIVPNEIFCLSK